MRKRILPALIGAFLLHPAQTQESVMSGFIPYDTHVEKLENGLTVIIMPIAATDLVAYWSIVRTGSRDEYEPGHTGFAHFFEHMMFRGTDAYPADVYNRILTSIGADANAYTTDDLTAYHISIAAEDLEQVMKLESDRFQNLAYAEPDFRTEAGAVYGEYRKNRTDPLFVIYEATMAEAFTVHTYGHTTMGYEEDIAAMPTMFDYSQSFFSRYYRPENTILFIAGGLEVAPVMRLVNTYYGKWEPGYVPPEIPVEPVQETERRIDVSYSGRTLPVLALAYKSAAFDPADRDRVAADLLVELAFGSTSEIYRQLVLDEQVLEFLATDAGLNRDPSVIFIYTRIKDPDKVDYVLETIDATIAQYQQSLPDEERLAALKSRLRYDFLMGLETPDDIARGLARHIAISGGLLGIEELYSAYETVSAEEIRAAARHYLTADRRVVAVLREQ
ncbi:MAG: insulinase family protein [Gammaproteobacteria bacterium]|nr:MAG: insulinase family protein [Gammaproteobacteria bacterium]